jgi:hypothetical protein
MKTLFKILLDLCKHEGWRYFTFDKDDREINFFRQNVKFSFDIFDDETHIVGMKFHDEEVDLTGDEYDAATEMINTTFKDDVEKMMLEDEEDTTQQDLEKHLNHHRL